MTAHIEPVVGAPTVREAHEQRSWPGGRAPQGASQGASTAWRSPVAPSGAPTNNSWRGNPRKTRSLRALGPVDIDALRAQVLAISEHEWEQENAGKPNRFQALGATQHIVFRFVSDVRDWRHSYDRPAWAQWRERLEPVLHQATRPYGYARGAFPRILLARMPPGGVIAPHVDANPAALWPHKIHVPLTTNVRVGFFIDPDTHHLAVGQAYEVNNLGLHAVRNDGETQRIHLIFEYYDEDQPV